MQYQHTQKGTLARVIVAMFIALSFVTAGIAGWKGPVGYSLYGIDIFIIVLLWLFSSLTVEVDGEELRHFFGPGFWKKSYLLIDIQSVKQVRNSWWYGWGIRLTPHGWLYNVSGLEAVEVRLPKGRTFRIGTNDPEGLCTALQSATC
jgi:hypothetical protein